MKLWTIQPVEWYEQLQKDGVIYGDKSHVDTDFMLGYEWLIEQMESRIGPRPINDIFPVWAWHSWDTSEKRRPDLRSTAHFMKGTKAVRLEIEKNPKDVLLSDFHLWHFPYAYHYYVGESEEDVNRFDAILKSRNLDWANSDFADLPDDLKKKIKLSWERIFDLEFYDEYVTYYKPEEKSVQATFWSLSLDEIKKVDYFTAR